jgi:hypothetical protein
MALNKFTSDVAFAERMQKEEAFFSKPFLLSYSGLNKLLFSPALFYNHYVLGQRDDTEDKNMVEGKLIHCLLLKPESFDDEFVLSSVNVPSDNPKKLLQTLFAHYKELKSTGDAREDLHEFSNAIIDILVDMNLYQSLKTDAQRLDKIITEDHVAYWDYMKKAEGRTVIDHDTHAFATAVVDKIKSKPVVMDVMGFFGDSMNGVTKQNEIELAKFDEELLFGLRGFVDNVVFDNMNKEIRVNDLKKTSKDIGSFTDSIEYFRYWMQAAIYYMLVEHVYLSQPAYADYKISFRFVVVDPYMQIAPIRVSDETMQEWLVKTKEKIAQANYHFENKSFELPYEFLINNEIVL